MILSELRELLKKYNDEDLRLLVVQMYKTLPKKIREEKDIDLLIQDVHTYASSGKAGSKDRQKDICVLKPEIDIFIDDAYSQYYFAPNNFVHKKERPKWRFKVKAYIKDLQEITIDQADGNEATELLQKIYKLLCYACAFYLFNTQNPFQSVGIRQTELLDLIIVRMFGKGISNESIKSVIELVINSQVDRETLYSYLIMILVMNLKSSDAKVIAIEQCKLLINELNQSKTVTTKKTWNSDVAEYKRIDKVNNLVEIIFRTNMELCEYEEAIKCFSKYYIERDAEISLYVLLALLLEYKQKEYWIREYAGAIKRGVKPRSVLQKTYEYIQENDVLPEYFQY